MTNDSKDWRLVNLPDQSNRFRNFFETRRKIKQLDAVAAAISRCEAILEGVQKQSISSADDQEVDANGDDSHNPPSKETVLDAKKPTPRYDDLLLTLLREETALNTYRTQENDPVRAFANAKGDVAYLNQLRSSDFLVFSSKTLLGKAFLPIFIVLFTAVSANIVGVRLQWQFLQQNRRFEVKLERLREAQRLTGNLYASVVDFQRRTERDEARKELGLKPINSLNDFNRELGQIRNMLAGVSTANINKSFASANDQVNATIKCFENQPKNSKDLSSSCSEKFNLEPFDELQDAISSALVEYLE